MILSMRYSLKCLSVVCVVGVLAANKPAFAQESAPSIDTCGLTQTEIDEGWIALFDGQSTFGWKASSNANWSVQKGVVEVSEGTPGLLHTRAQFDDFEFKAEFKIESDTNSGIFIRTSPKPRDPTGDCYEINLAGPQASPFPTGSLVQRKTCKDLTEGDEAWFATWHQINIRADGPEVSVSIDGDPVLDYTNEGKGRLGKGYIGLQLNSGRAQFKSIHLKPLNVPAIFNGKDLTGWKTDQKLESKFSITRASELNILSGKGQIESRDTYADFVFSMKCKTNADGLNSGVFFRCIPGDIMNGYESQIQNQFKSGDRSVPEDCGTGGIFRRVAARSVNADDQKWFSKTIVANGPHLAVWVNGLQVTDWSDQRKPNANPRRGRRLEAGTIIFQGHDPTTDILLKDIGARELESRK